MYTNINGLVSKKDSLQTITNMENPHIITLTEMKTNNCPKIKGYTRRTQTKPNKAGGIAIAIRDDIINNTEAIKTEEDDRLEIAWIKIKAPKTTIYRGTYYGKQEGELKETVEREFATITRQVLKIKEDGHIILTGDFNAKLPILKNNTTIQERSRNGKIMERMLEMTTLTPISTKSKKGTWTRANRHNTLEKSIIDYIICDDHMSRSLTDIVIDEEGILRPKGKNETDHNTIISQFNIPVTTNRPTITRWNIHANTDWKKYNNIISRQPLPQTYNQFESRIYEALTETAGKKTMIYNNKPRISKDSKELKKQTKNAKKKFEQECKRNGTGKKKLYDKYIELSKKLKTNIEQDIKEQIKKNNKPTDKRRRSKIKTVLEDQKQTFKKTNGRI
jgi:hypothetical protein